MISHAHFGKLRLAQFRPDMEIVELDNWEFMDHLWDRVSYEFVVPGPPRYDVSCTVLNQGGLTYLVVMVPLPSRRG